MTTLITDVPGDVAAFRLNGKITTADYENVILPRVDEVAKSGKVRFLLVLETSIGNFSLGAVWNDVKVGLKHLGIWHKSAIVSDEQKARTLTDTAGQLIPGEVRSFSLAELEEAKQWVAA